MKLGVNVDHVATLRNLRGTSYPCVVTAARTAMEAGASFVTVHLREDRRHVRDSDLAELVRDPYLVMNLEMAPTEEMLDIAVKYSPSVVCLVPEKRNEVTTERGLDAVCNAKYLQDYIKKLQYANIKVTLFLDPIKEQIEQALALNADCVELHVGEYCYTRTEAALNKVRAAAKLCGSLGLECHAGHGIDYETASALSEVPGIAALNVGHFIVCESVKDGMRTVIRNMLSIIASPPKT